MTTEKQRMSNWRFVGLVAAAFLFGFQFVSGKHPAPAVKVAQCSGKCVHGVPDDDESQYWICKVDGFRCNRTLDWMVGEEVRRARDITVAR